jgi:hypothetical protein
VCAHLREPAEVSGSSWRVLRFLSAGCPKSKVGLDKRYNSATWITESRWVDPLLSTTSTLRRGFGRCLRVIPSIFVERPLRLSVTPTAPSSDSTAIEYLPGGRLLRLHRNLIGQYEITCIMHSVDSTSGIRVGLRQRLGIPCLVVVGINFKLSVGPKIAKSDEHSYSTNTPVPLAKSMLEVEAPSFPKTRSFGALEDRSGRNEAVTHARHSRKTGENAPDAATGRRGC